ncbi:hypothetical protein BDZ89DRAFT_1086743 [Hymenopellis radicata]|nr:hypothetical protein BDZ89DRAFT_1086743 [Hymenopellis radicata]
MASPLGCFFADCSSGVLLHGVLFLGASPLGRVFKRVIVSGASSLCWRVSSGGHLRGVDLRGRRLRECFFADCLGCFFADCSSGVLFPGASPLGRVGSSSRERAGESSS